jgi:hypothetical protein
VVGTVLKAKHGGGTYRIVGEHEGGYVIRREDAHESPEHVMAADLHARFGVQVHGLQPVDETAAWEQFGTAFEEDAQRALRGDVERPTESPEDVFVRVSDADARRLGHR